MTDSLTNRVNERVFNTLHLSPLIYNTCREDSAVNRPALDLTGNDAVLVITSAGCNVLDYALAMLKPDGLRVPYYRYVGRKLPVQDVPP
ncbi:MAG: DUF3419 family protein [Burkholderiales bacterium]|nr:DUF3419 family protein [Burkholderiales bacterium]